MDMVVSMTISVFDSSLKLPSKETDGRYWLRGYDSGSTRRRYFADPVDFMTRLRMANGEVRWHPPGSILVDRDRDSEAYLVISEAEIVPVDPGFRAVEELDRYALYVNRSELDCYRERSWGMAPEGGRLFTICYFR